MKEIKRKHITIICGYDEKVGKYCAVSPNLINFILYSDSIENLKQEARRVLLHYYTLKELSGITVHWVKQIQPEISI
ncbi:MAG: hypothetical protein IJX26_03060 [Clostridia bacterium]|nr:hypothetical protein [Clostridia bacterium]